MSNTKATIVGLAIVVLVAAAVQAQQPPPPPGFQMPPAPQISPLGGLPVASPAPSSSGVLSFLQEMGPQLQKASAVQSIFSSLSDSGQQAQQSSANQANQLMNQLSSLSSLVRSKSAEAAQSAQDSASQVANQANQAAVQANQNTQTGVRSALSELSNGLQRIASNNPALLGDVKNLYSSVSSKLSSSTSSASGPIVPAKNQDQLVDNLAKVAAGQTQ